MLSDSVGHNEATAYTVFINKISCRDVVNVGNLGGKNDLFVKVLCGQWVETTTILQTAGSSAGVWENLSRRR